MQEKQKELFDQYDMELLHVRKGRGGLICETKQGRFDLKVCRCSPKRLEQAYEMKEHLIQHGFIYVDQYIRNKEGELLSYDRYQTPYNMKKHIDGKECDIRNEHNISLAGTTLGVLHKQLKTIDPSNYPAKQHTNAAKTRELLRTKQYIISKNEKKEFEKLFLQYFDLFWKEISPQKNNHSHELFLCHGNYQHHNLILLDNGQMGVVQFEDYYAGNQMDDLFYLLRKILEKNQYRIEVAQRLLLSYEKIFPFTKNDLNYLYEALSYPEKYYKLANQYMNHRKSFLSPKLTEKLLEAVKLQDKKERFLLDFKANYL